MGPRKQLEPRLRDVGPDVDGWSRLDALLVDLSVKFINLQPGEVDREVGDAQRLICECVGVDLSALWQWAADDPGNYRLTHLYRPLGGPPIPEPADARELFPWCLGLIAAGKQVVVSSLDDVPAAAAQDVEVWRHYGIRSVLGFPLAVGGEPPVGALSFDMVTEARTWPATLIDRLGMVARIFAKALARKRADERLRESEERLALAADSAGAGLWSLDLASGRFSATPRTLELLGLPAGETLTLERFLEVVHPEDRPLVRRTVQQVVESEEEGQAEFRVAWPDGSETWIASRGRTRQGSGANPTRLTGVAIDITPRKRFEQTTRNLSGRILAAHEEERARLARELHDAVIQRLVCAAIDVARIAASHPAPPAGQSLERLRSDLVRLSEDVHELAYHLHPSILTELGVVAAITTECERFCRQQSLPVETSFCPAPESLTGDGGLCLFRVTQEALRNVARHARASRVRVSLEQRDGGLRLTVRDDGRGFDPAESPKPRSLGLTGMRERLRLLGGKLDVDSAPGRGTSILAWLPLERSPA